MAENMVNKQQFNFGWDRESFMHTFAHVIGTLSPFIIVFIVCIFSSKGNLWEFLKDGDFCLFSAAILTPAAYSFASYKPKRKNTNAGKHKLVAENMWVLSIILIGISSVLFLLIYIHAIDCSFSIYPNAIVIVSMVFLIASFVIFYLSKYLHREINFDINDLEEESFDSFEAQYKRLK